MHHVNEPTAGHHPPRRKRAIRTVVLAATLVSTLALLTACGSSNSSSSSDGSKASTIVVAVPEQATQLSYDAGWESSDDFAEMQGLINANLIRKKYVKTDEKGVVKQDLYSFEGVLAKDYTISDDGMTVTFDIRKGVKSQHGNEFTANDVLWNYERKFGSDTSIVKYVVAPEITDPDSQFKVLSKYQIALTVPRPGDMFTTLSVLADVTGQLYDSTYLKEHVTKSDPWATKWSTNRTDFMMGPYRVKSMTAGTETVLTANPGYALGEPKIKTIIRRVVADAGSRYNALKTGAADVALGLKSKDMATLEKEKGFVSPTIPANNFDWISLTTTNAPFNNVKVRQAMAYAIDYGQIVKEIFAGRAEQTSKFLLTDAPGYDGSGLPSWSYNPAKAKSMLEAAGIATPVAFTLTIPSSDAALQDSAVSIQSSAKAAGFDITIQSIPYAQYSTKTQGGETQAALTVGSAFSLSPSYELNLFTSKASTNISKWSDDEFQATVTAGIESGDALTDKAGKYWNAAEKIWLGDEVPMIILAHTEPTTATSTRLTGWTWRTDNSLDYSVMSITK
jgi:peptide/nickel transport system substrate-binding protein